MILTLNAEEIEMPEEEEKLSITESIRRKIKSGQADYHRVPTDLLDGRYRLLARIGDDQWTLSFKAGYELLQRYVKVRILKPEFRGNEEGIRAVEMEGHVAASAERTREGRFCDLSTNPSGLPYIVYKWEPEWNSIDCEPISSEQARVILTCVRKNPPNMSALSNRPMTVEEQQALQDAVKMAMGVARDMTNEMKTRSASVRQHLGRAHAELEKQGLRAAWQDVIAVFMTAASEDESWMASHLNQSLEDLVGRFGEADVREFLTEYFSQWIDKFDNGTKYKNKHSNKRLAIAFQIAQHVERPDVYMTDEQRAKWLKDFEDTIEEK